MFTRSTFGTPTLIRQHDILRRAAHLVDAGIVKTTLTERLHGITVENLRRAHALIEQGGVHGKIVLEGT